MQHPSRYDKVFDALYPEREEMRQRTERIEELKETAIHYGRTIIFALGVVKAVELTFKTRLL